MTAQPDEDLTDLRRSLIHYAKSYGVDHATAEDVTHDAFLKLHDQGTGGAPSRPWLFVVTRNRSIDAVRNQRRTVPLDYANHDIGSDWFEEFLETSDTADIAAQAMLAVRPRYREILVRSILHGETAAETASALGIGVDNVRQIKARAIKQLRKEFTRLGGSSTGFALIFPTLGYASRSLRRIGVSGITAAVVVIAASAVPQVGSGATSAVPPQTLPAIATTPLGPENERLVGLRLLQSRLLGGPGGTVAPPHKPVSRAASIMDILPAKCVHPVVDACVGPDHPSGWFVGVTLMPLSPPPVCTEGHCVPRSAAVSEDVLDLSGVCPTTHPVPVIVCERVK